MCNLNLIFELSYFVASKSVLELERKCTPCIVMSFIPHLENNSSLDYADLPNVNTLIWYKKNHDH